MLDAYYHEAHSMSIVAQHRKSIDFPYFLCSILPEAIREALKKQKRQQGMGSVDTVCYWLTIPDGAFAEILWLYG